MSEGYRYSYNLIGFGGEDVSRSIDRLARLGYGAAEIEGEPDRHDAKKVKRVADAAGLAISSVCPNFTPKRDLSHPDPELRATARSYLRAVADFAAELEAPLFIVAPTAYQRVRPVATLRDEWQWAVEGVRSAGEHAASVSVDLSLECWNRYGTYMLNRLDEGAQMWRDTGLRNGGVMADTFHMNVEERSLPEALRGIGDLLNHVHLSDSNRLAPGLGHINFVEVLRTLDDVGYRGSLAFELIPAPPNLLEEGPAGTSLDDVARQAIEHSREAGRVALAGRREASRS